MIIRSSLRGCHHRFCPSDACKRVGLININNTQLHFCNISFCQFDDNHSYQQNQTIPQSMADTRCRFLELPMELRLLIYGFAVLNAPVVTVGAAKLVGSGPDLVDRQHGANRYTFKGMPRDYEPVVSEEFDSALLLSPSEIKLTPLTVTPVDTTCSWAASKSLQRVNRQINRELQDHVPLPAHRRTSLYVNYPHGLPILQTTAPDFLRQCRSVHLVGSYFAPESTTPRNFGRPRAGRFVYGYPAPPISPLKPHVKACLDTVGHLSQLIGIWFGRAASYPIEMLELRIFFPGDNHSTIWSEDSPISIALRNIAKGRIDIVVWRGSRGNGTVADCMCSSRCAHR